MADECIVCLGSLTEYNPDLSSLKAVSSPHLDGNVADDKNGDPDRDNVPEDKCIAFLPSCGHYLHNECLKSWIERANSCPICRKSFNTVDLWTTIGGKSQQDHMRTMLCQGGLLTLNFLGPAISTYAVDDKVQEAVIDPDILADVEDDDEEDDENQVCQVCEEDDNEDILMYCDNCSKLYHTYCVGLQEVPVGHWFCEHCRAARSENTRTVVQRRSRGRNRRTRGQQRRYRQLDRAHEQSWNRVWQSVWDRINLDLDFPFDDEEATAIHVRRQRQRNDHDRRQYQAWQRRAQIAELQGGANRFRDTAQPLLEDFGETTASATRRPRPETPPRESPDEIRAWQAFDRAREIEGDSVASRTRKRKSTTASPAEPDPTPVERRVKRPRVRRQLELAEASDSAESSSHRRASPNRQQPAENQSAGPSFLQSLLKEVQGSSTPNQRSGPYFPSGPIHTPPNEQNSPTPSSPILSPVPSNHSSPRAASATPPPLHYARPGSPTGLSSSIQPIFPHFENAHARPPPEPAPVSPTTDHPAKDGGGLSLSDSENVLGLRRIPRSHSHHSPPSRARSTDASPARQKLSLSAKSDVQKMVSTALKPFYSDGVVSKDDFTSINRDVSRLMYDRIGEGGIDGLGSEHKKKWETMASEEVRKAIEQLKISRNGIEESSST